MMNLRDALTVNEADVTRVDGGYISNKLIREAIQHVETTFLIDTHLNPVEKLVVLILYNMMPKEKDGN